MRILFLTPWYPNESNPNHGVFVRDQVRVLSETHQVCVVAARIDYSLKAFSSIQKKSVASGNVWEHMLVVKQSWPIFNQLNFFYPGAVWGYIISKLAGVPFVVTEHTRITNNFRSWLHKRLAIYALNRAACIIVVSKAPAEEIYKYLKHTRLAVVPNVINFDRFQSVGAAPVDYFFHIGFLGGLDTPVKGLDILLQAVAKLPFPFQLHIGGKGVLLDEYKKLAVDCGVYQSCKFYGFVNYDTVPGFMARINLFVSASRYETFGIAVAEALACGRPIVVTDSGGPADLVKPENGILVPIENVQKMAEAIQSIFNLKEEYNPELIRTDIRNRYSAAAFRIAIEKIYMEAVKQSH